MNAWHCVSFLKRIVVTSLLVNLLALDVQGQTTDETQQELLQIQNELKQRQNDLKASQASAEEIEAVLKASEIEIGAVARQLNETQQRLTTNKQEQHALTQRQVELEDAIGQQQGLLSSQLRSAFMAGHYDYAKMLFYQDDARHFERVLTYYQYVNKARQQSIEKFRASVNELVEVKTSLEQKQQALSALLANQTRQQRELTARQSDRKITLSALNKKIASDAAKVEALQASEQALKRALEAAQLAAERAAQQENIVLSGLAKFKGQLEKPASGRVMRLFGKRRQGQVRWKGVVIEGNEGSAISAVSAGRVLYADWLKGFGLVTIIDHGAGYMSVYGHSQALLKKVGDTVVAGETIALVGQSGGQSYPNLYFEIRHKGKALNPSSWLARR